MTRSTLIATLAASTLFGGCCPEVSVSSTDTDDNRPSWADDLGPRPDWTNDEDTDTDINVDVYCDEGYVVQSVNNSQWTPVCAIPRPTLNWNWPYETTSLNDVAEIFDLQVPIEGDGDVEVHGVTVEFHYVGDTEWFDSLYDETVQLSPVVNGTTYAGTLEVPDAGFPGGDERAGTLFYRWSSFANGGAGNMPSSFVNVHDQLGYHINVAWHDLAPLYSGIMVTANVTWTSPDAPGHVFHTRTNGVYWYVTE